MFASQCAAPAYRVCTRLVGDLVVPTLANIAFTVTRHIQEIEMIRGKVYSLEQQHNQMKAK
jgi:hypothetical protein